MLGLLPSALYGSLVRQGLSPLSLWIWHTDAPPANVLDIPKSGDAAVYLELAILRSKLEVLGRPTPTHSPTPAFKRHAQILDLEVGVDLCDELRIGVPQHPLRDDERHATPSHAGSGGVPQRVDVDDPSERVPARDAGSIEYAAKESAGVRGVARPVRAVGRQEDAVARLHDAQAHALVHGAEGK